MESGVEKLIYLYTVICLALIIFNFVCIFIFRARAGVISRRASDLRKMMVSEKAGVLYKLHALEFSENSLLALEKTVDELRQSDPGSADEACREIAREFAERITGEQIKDPIILSYVMYLAKKYGLFIGTKDEKLKNHLVRLTMNSGFYVRKAALELLNNIGDPDALLDALHLMDHEGISQNEKLLHDGLLEFSGDKEKLWKRIWEEFDDFSPLYQSMFLKYFRFAGGNFREKVFSVLRDKNRDSEVHFSCLRYLARYPLEEARPFIYELIRTSKDRIWEYAVVAVSALASYPGGETRQLLKKMLSDSNWYVRSNAAESLLRLGNKDGDFDEILDGNDRYAREALQYAIDRKRIEDSRLMKKNDVGEKSR